jgi:hypothetical protein
MAWQRTDTQSVTANNPAVTINMTSAALAAGNSPYTFRVWVTVTGGVDVSFTSVGGVVATGIQIAAGTKAFLCGPYGSKTMDGIMVSPGLLATGASTCVVDVEVWTGGAV